MAFKGYRIGNTTIGITQIPDRKRPCLYVMKGTTLYPVAYFTKAEYAEMFARELDRFICVLEQAERSEE